MTRPAPPSTPSWTSPPAPRRPALLAVAVLVVAALVLLPACASASAPAAGEGRGAGEGSWPLVPVPAVVERFAPPAQAWQPGHRGVDLAGRPGQSVHAALPGTVSFAGRVAGKPVVVVTHGTTRTTYEPVVPLVREGDRVGRGDRLGLLTLPFSHCYPAACLHWGLRRGETYLDPLLLVGDAVRIRLLPLPPLRRAGAPDGRPSAAGRW